MAIQFHKTLSQTEWLSYRSRGIGASEVGTILGLNEYECKLQVHHRKLGILAPKKRNLRMHLGGRSEDFISDMWEYWVADENVFCDNLDNNKKVRECRKVDAYCTNDKYPNLFVSLDREFTDSKHGLSALELKNKTYSSYSKWENKMNPCEVVQLSTQLLVSEYQYGEICYLIDNTRMEVMNMTYNDAKGIEKKIVKETDLFWKNILDSRIIMNKIHDAKTNYNMKLVADLQVQLYSLEPDPEETEAYLDYMTELSRDKKSITPLKGNDDLYAIAKNHKLTSDKIKALEAKRIKYQCELAFAMKDKKEIDFGKLGKVSLFGKFSNKIKL